MPTYQVGTQPVQVYSAGDIPGVIYNRSITIPVNWGISANDATSGNASILDPNATIGLNGDADIWVVCTSGSALIDVMPSVAAYFRGITQGFGALSIPSIFSPNFIEGVSGWSIDKDGSAEFNNLTIRGTFFGTDFILNATGLYFYSGTPALGNLILSITNAGGFDPFGNVVPVGGFFMYETSGNALLGLIWNTVAGSQPLVALFPDSSFGFTGHSPFVLSQANNKGLASEFLALAMGPGGPVTSPVMLQLLGASPDGTTSIPHMRVYAGANYTLACDILLNGIFAAQPGTNNTETWHPMTLLSSWAAVAGFAAPQYRIVAAPANSVEITASLNAAAATAGLVATLPAGYRPAHTQPVCAVGANAAVPAGLSPWIRCDTAGNLNMQNTGGLPAAWQTFIHGFIALDA